MIIFPMLGSSSRFRKEGFSVPKYMLPLGNETIFEKSVKGFESQFSIEEFIFILRDDSIEKEFVNSRLLELKPKIEKFSILTLSEETSGQAETVYRGLIKLGRDFDMSVTIFNIDTHHLNFSYPPNLKEVDGYIEVTKKSGDHWSFVKPKENQKVKNKVGLVAEKRRISDLCSTGLYYFKSASFFLEQYEISEKDFISDQSGDERYVAPIYNFSINSGYDIEYFEIPEKEIIFTGTPDEYFYEIRRLGPKIAFNISGQIRGSYKTLVEISNQAKKVGADVFLSTWKDTGNKSFLGATGISQIARIFPLRTCLMFPFQFYNSFEKLFPKTQQELMKIKTSKVDELELKNLIPSLTIDVEEEKKIDLSLSTPTGDKNSLKMLYKIWRCNQLKRKKEEDQKIKYEYVIRFRPDVMPNIIPFLEQVKQNDIILLPASNANFYIDTFWMCNSQHDNILSSFFANAVLKQDRGWTNIHEEYKRFIIERELPVTLNGRYMQSLPSNEFDIEVQRDLIRHLILELKNSEEILKSYFANHYQHQILLNLLDEITPDNNQLLLDHVMHYEKQNKKLDLDTLRGLIIYSMNSLRNFRNYNDDRLKKLILSTIDFDNLKGFTNKAGYTARLDSFLNQETRTEELQEDQTIIVDNLIKKYLKE